MVDPRLNANPKVDEAHHRVSPAGFKYLVTEMVCWATAGPQNYTGRSMKDSHQHLGITATEWEAFLDDLQQILDKFNVMLRVIRHYASSSLAGTSPTYPSTIRAVSRKLVHKNACPATAITLRTSSSASENSTLTG
jgi:hypothetical protein